MNFANVGKLRVKRMSNGDRFVLMPFYDGSPKLLLPKNLLKKPFVKSDEIEYGSSRGVRNIVLADAKRKKLPYDVFLKPIFIKGDFETPNRLYKPSHEARMLSALLSHGFKAETPLAVYLLNRKNRAQPPLKTHRAYDGRFAGYLVTKTIAGEVASFAEANALEKRLEKHGFVPGEFMTRHVIKNKDGLFIVDAEMFSQPAASKRKKR